MGTAEVWVMFGGGGNCHIQQGRKRGLATRPTCLSPSVCEPGITGSHNPCVLPAPSLSPGLVTKLLSREITGVAIAL